MNTTVDVDLHDPGLMTVTTVGWSVFTDERAVNDKLRYALVLEEVARFLAKVAPSTAISVAGKVVRSYDLDQKETLAFRALVDGAHVYALANPSELGVSAGQVESCTLAVIRGTRRFVGLR